MNVSTSAIQGARIRQVSITAAAVNIFAVAAGPPVVPFVQDNRGTIAFVLYNLSGNDWYLGYDNTVTDDAGANPGVKVPAGGSISRQVGGRIINDGVWVLTKGAGPDDGTVEEFV